MVYSFTATGENSFSVAPPIVNDVLVRKCIGSVNQGYFEQPHTSADVIPYGPEHTARTAFYQLAHTLQQFGHVALLVPELVNTGPF